jgi:hypothetical protein
MKRNLSELEFSQNFIPKDEIIASLMRLDLTVGVRPHGVINVIVQSV